LKPIPATLRGFVLDRDLYTTLAATVEVTSGSNKGKRATLSFPWYFLRDVWGDFDVSASFPGYDTGTVRASIAGRQTDMNVLLRPATPPGHVAFSGRLCSVSSPAYPNAECTGTNYPYPTEASHLLTRGRQGSATLGVRYTYVGDYYDTFLNLEMSCEGQVIFETRVKVGWKETAVFVPGDVVGPVAVDFPRPCDYQIRLFNYLSDRKGGNWTTYRVDIDPPK
jgi:hypothetical protein